MVAELDPIVAFVANKVRDRVKEREDWKSM